MAPALRRRPRALLVDDDPFVRHALGSRLDAAGIDCLHADSGRIALQRLSEERDGIDLLVTDLVMPDVAGDALILAVREAGGDRDLPIVVVSGCVDAECARALREAGADVVVDKASGLGPVVAAVRWVVAESGRVRPQEPAAGSGSVPLFRIELARRMS